MSTPVTVLWLILQIPAASLEWLDTAVSVLVLAPTTVPIVKHLVSGELGFLCDNLYQSENRDDG